MGKKRYRIQIQIQEERSGLCRCYYEYGRFGCSECNYSYMDSFGFKLIAFLLGFVPLFVGFACFIILFFVF